jgi:hypothetical protein
MYLTVKDKWRLKWKEQEKIFQATEGRKQIGIAILKSEKADFKPKLVRGDK